MAEGDAYKTVGNIDLQRHEPYLVAEHIQAVIQLWLDDCADRLDDVGPDGAYRGTTAGYAAKIVHFVQWWADVGPGYDWRLSRTNLREFERWLRQRDSRYGEPLAYHSRRDVLRRLRACLRWAQAEGYVVNVAPADWVPSPAGDPPERTLVPDSALVALLRAVERTAHPVRNAAILAMLIGTGIRRQECAGLRVEDVRMDADLSGTVVVRDSKRTKRGRIVRTVAFDHVAGAYLDRWLEILSSSSGALFPSQKTGEAMAPRSLGRIVRQCWDLAGLDAGQPCHDLRRKFVTEWRRLHRGADMDELLQRQVGHADGGMTSQYSLQGVEDVRAVFSSPLTNIEPPDD